jgi:hypothetical protein
MRFLVLLIFYFSLLVFSCKDQGGLYDGMRITKSLQLTKDTFLFAEAKAGADPTLLIEGQDIIVDFGGSILIGSADLSRPQDFKNVAVHVKGGANITIKNLNVRGYAVGLFVEGVDHLHIENCDFSYLRRVSQNQDNPDLKFPDVISADTVTWMQNLAGGAGVFLRDCKAAQFTRTTINHAQNGVILDHCDEGFFFNNSIQFNAGIGLGLYQSNNNEIMFNELDWNIISSKVNKATGGLLFLGNCQQNKVAFNSITHSGSDQLFYEGIDKDRLLEGNSNNRILSNDFSYASPDGIAQSFDAGNQWQGNVLTGCQREIVEEQEDTASKISTLKKSIEEAIDSIVLPGEQKGENPILAAAVRQGCKYRIMDDYGPYDFSYPHLEPRGFDPNGNYLFTIFGPPGNWEAKGGKGFKRMSLKRGTIPATLVLEIDSISGIEKAIELEYIGPAFTDTFGKLVEKGKPFSLYWHE